MASVNESPNPIAKKEFHQGLHGTPNTAIRSTLALGILAGTATLPMFTFIPFSNFLDKVLIGETPNASTAFFENEGAVSWTPGLFAASALLPALVVPATIAIERFIYNKPWGSICSVQNKFRWDWFRTVAKRVIPVTAVAGACVCLYQPPGWPVLEYRPLITSAVVATIMPLAAVAEEFGFRGLITRVVSSWISDPDTAFWASTGAASALFSVMHMSGGTWNNLYYLVAGVSTSLMTRWSGGLEASSVVHSACNAMLLLPIVMADNKALMDRYTSPKGLGAEVLLPVVNAIGITYLVRQLCKEKKVVNEQ